MRMGWKIGIAVCAFGLLLPVVGQAEPVGACGDDIARLCADAPRGMRGVASCLKANRDALSPECGAQVDERAAKRRHTLQMREACLKDLRAFCEEVESARDRVGCLRQHRDELTPQCRDALPGASGR
jgi:hypothetical protein